MINLGLAQKYLVPSSIITSRQPVIIKTVLGSCISVCMFDPKNKIGGMNHFMMPYWQGVGLATPKFGNIAMRKLYDSLLKMGAAKEHLISKVFGGAEMLNITSETFNIGKKNIAASNAFLNEFEIPVYSSDVGGKQGRKILFNTSTGEVLLQRIDNRNKLK